MDKFSSRRWAWRGRPPVLLRARGWGCACKRDPWGEHRCQEIPEVCQGAEPVAASGGQGPGVSHSSSAALHTASSPPTPSCVALGKFLTCLNFRFLFCKTKPVLRLWEAFEEAVKGPGMLSVLTSLVPTEHLEVWELAPGVLLAHQPSGEEGTF